MPWVDHSVLASVRQNNFPRSSVCALRETSLAPENFAALAQASAIVGAVRRREDSRDV